MTNNLIPLTELTLSLGLAYVLHSTLLLIGVAVLLRAGRASSHTLRERLWKLAVVVPLLTSPLQVWSDAAPIPDGWQFSVATHAPTVAAEPASQTQTDSGPSHGGSLNNDARGEAFVDPHAVTAVTTNAAFEATARPQAVPSRSEAVGAVEPGIGAPTLASEAPLSGLRPPSSLGGEGTGISGRTAAAVAETRVENATGIEALAAASSIATSPVLTPAVALAPNEPLPTSNGEPRVRQPDWPPLETPKSPRSETVVVTAAAASPANMTTQVEPAVSLDPVAFGFALAVLASIAGGLFLLIVQRGRFWRRLRKCRVVADGVTRSELDKLLNRKQIRRRVRLLVSDGFVEPVACGVLRWTIIVPHGVEQRLNRDQIEGLLAHELAHLVRGDTAWLWVGNIVCSCLWFQPLNFLARRRWQQAAEFLSDEWAVADANVSPLSLAQCLTKIAEWRLDRQESSAILAAGGHRSTLSSRIDCLVQDERPHDAWKSRRRKRAVLVGVLAAGGALVWSVPRAEFVHADSPPRSGTGSDAGESETEEPSVPVEEELSPAVNPGQVIADPGAKSLTPIDSPETFLEASAPQSSADWQAEWNELQAELKGLNADLIRVAGLLEKYPGDARVRELAEQIRARAVSFEARRLSLDEQIKASQKDSDE